MQLSLSLGSSANDTKPERLFCVEGPTHTFEVSGICGRVFVVDCLDEQASIMVERGVTGAYEAEEVTKAYDAG